MKLVMTLLVRDEEDILESHLRFHLGQGVDFFIVTDNLSVDGTREILRGFERQGVARVIEEPDDTYAQATWVTRMARMACTNHGADWVIPSDADEFWWPKHGSLKSTLEAIPPGMGIVSAPRVNFLPRPEVEGELFARMTLREVVSYNSLGAPLPPKICHRALPEIQMWQGNHGARAPGLSVNPGRQPLVILHFPMRTYPQFENKVLVGGRAYERNTELPEAAGRTWRELYRGYQASRLADYYAEHVLADGAIQAGIASGRLIRDYRLRRALA